MLIIFGRNVGKGRRFEHWLQLSALFCHWFDLIYNSRHFAWIWHSPLWILVRIGCSCYKLLLMYIEQLWMEVIYASYCNCSSVFAWDEKYNWWRWLLWGEKVVHVQQLSIAKRQSTGRDGRVRPNVRWVAGMWTAYGLDVVLDSTSLMPGACSCYSSWQLLMMLRSRSLLSTEHKRTSTTRQSR